MPTEGIVGDTGEATSGTQPTSLMSRRLIRLGCRLWVASASLMLAADFGLIFAFFEGISMMMQYEPGTPVLGPSVGALFLAAGVMSAAAALVFGIGTLILEPGNRTASGQSTSLKGALSSRETAFAAALVSTYGLFSAAGVATFIALPLLNVFVSWDFATVFITLWAIGAVALAAGLALAKTNLVSSMVGSDAESTHLRIVIYAIVTAGGAFLLALGFAVRSGAALVSMGTAGAALLLVAGPALVLGAFWRLARAFRSPDPTPGAL